MHHAQAALAIGSETSGGVRNVVASNITVRDTVNGIHLKSRRGRGGVVEDIRFDNWTMENVGQAISISDAGYSMEGEAADFGPGPVTNRTPSFRNIAISHVTIHGAQGLIDVSGIQEMPTAGVRISDVVGQRAARPVRFLHGRSRVAQRAIERGVRAGVPHDALHESAVGRCQHPFADLAGTPVIRLERRPAR